MTIDKISHNIKHINELFIIRQHILLLYGTIQLPPILCTLFGELNKERFNSLSIKINENANKIQT